MKSERYFLDTEPAVRHMFEALAAYDALTVPPSLASYADERGVATMTPRDAKRYLHELSRSLALDFAKATLCGSILQVAHMAILLYSTNSEVTPEHAALGVRPGSNAAKFCVGRVVHGLPMGLLVYAARNQYNHWDEGKLRAVPAAVLAALGRVYADDPQFDLAYCLDWPSPRPISHYVVRHELRWMTYEGYLGDMQKALG